MPVGIDRNTHYLDELQKEYPDPIAHFTEVARRMTQEETSRDVTMELEQFKQIRPTALYPQGHPAGPLGSKPLTRHFEVERRAPFKDQ